VQVTGRALHCQVSDAGRADADGRAARARTGVAVRPWLFQPGHGLWLARSITDHLAVASGPAGSQVTAVFALPDADGDQGGRVPPQRRLADSGGDGR
jgi:anti-sigma regulatory factor (Ser/Thr protein kinase)